ncbi:unnamed protein product [Urochloa decumbens]|uniref:Gnk2-homologous domain-containing protein n=1 Tax=Urochloa decumbens TaxID=240449 RepID=A0ABC9FBX7_9POAL
MTISPLLPIFVLVAASPLAADAWSSVSCGGGGGYTANSTYEANLHHLAAVLPAEAAASHRRYASHAFGFGYWPNRLQADWSCRSSDAGDCAACIADAFKSVELECPFSREAFFFGGNCSLKLGEYRILDSDVFRTPLVVGMIFQAFGLACLFLLFLRAWRHDIKKGTITHHTPLSGDQHMSK